MTQVHPNIDNTRLNDGQLQAPLNGVNHGRVQKPNRHNLEFIGQERDISDFKRAARHSNWVGLFKYLLPIFAIVIIASLFAALMLRPKLQTNISIGSSGIADGKLIMNNPKLDGLDPQNRPYSVRAVRAIQSVEDPTLVDLDQIDAKLPMENGLWANVKAANGSFDVKQKKLELGGG